VKVRQKKFQWVQEQFENFAKTVWEPLETVSGLQ
jgi:hypothetical protein